MLGTIQPIKVIIGWIDRYADGIYGITGSKANIVGSRDFSNYQDAYDALVASFEPVLATYVNRIVAMDLEYRKSSGTKSLAQLAKDTSTKDTSTKSASADIHSTYLLIGDAMYTNPAEFVSLKAAYISAMRGLISAAMDNKPDSYVVIRTKGNTWIDNVSIYNINYYDDYFLQALGMYPLVGSN